MSSIQLAAVQKAIRMLEAVGARFGVEFEDFKAGVALPPQRTGKGAVIYDNVAVFDYPTVCSKMKPGDVHVFRHDNVEHLKSLRGSIGSFGIRSGRGGGAFMTAISKDHKSLEVLCVIGAPEHATA